MEEVIMDISIEDTDIGVEDWIDGASFTQVKVKIHRNPALWAELKPVYDELMAAQSQVLELEAAERRGNETREESSLGEVDETVAVPADEASLGEESQPSPTLQAAREELAAIKSRAEELYERYDNDAEVWHLRALTREEAQAIGEQHTVPEPPKKPANLKGSAKAAFMRKMEQYSADMNEMNDSINEMAVQLAVVKVEVNGAEKKPPSLEGIRRLKKRPHGDKHFAELLQALNAITLQEVAIPSPKSLVGSGDDQI